MSGALRIAIVADYLEEGWPSMDLVADMLMRELGMRYRESLCVNRLRPRFVARFSRAGAANGRRLFNADRFLNRLVDYPRYLRARRNEFDLFHIVDHSYSHLAPVVEPAPAIVTCHDLDAFRCLTEPQIEVRSWPFRQMTKKILRGFRRAAAVACVSFATRDHVLREHLVPAQRLAVNPNGVEESFNTRPDPRADRLIEELLGPPDRRRIEIVHVGSTIPRKRIDVLLRVFAALRREVPGARLLRLGGAFTAAQRQLIDQLGLPPDSVAQLPFLSRQALAAVYRRAALAVLPSEAEGFGLPALEAMACGRPVVLSDIPALREVGGTAAVYRPVADVDGWTEAIRELLKERVERPRCWTERVAEGLRWAGRFTWKEYADRAVKLYGSVDAADSRPAGLFH